ncbi:MAG: hypothetical protein WCW01_00560 [Gammaproteobacteria bacterium]
MLQFSSTKPFEKDGDILLSISMGGFCPALESDNPQSSSTTTSVPTSSSSSSSSSSNELAVKFTPEDQTGTPLLAIVNTLINELKKYPNRKGIITLLNTTHLHRFNVMPRIWEKGDTLGAAEIRAAGISKLYWSEWQKQNQVVVKLLQDFAKGQGREKEWCLDWSDVIGEPEFKRCLGVVRSWSTPNQNDVSGFRKNLGKVKGRFSEKIAAKKTAVRKKIEDHTVTWENISDCCGHYMQEESAFQIFLHGEQWKKFPIEVYRGVLGSPMYIARARIGEVYKDFKLTNELLDVGTPGELELRKLKIEQLLAGISHSLPSGRQSPPSSSGSSTPRSHEEGTALSSTSTGTTSSNSSSSRAESPSTSVSESISASKVNSSFSTSPPSDPTLLSDTPSGAGTSHGNSNLAPVLEEVSQQDAVTSSSSSTRSPVAELCLSGGGKFLFFTVAAAAAAAAAVSREESGRAPIPQEKSKSKSPPTSPTRGAENNTRPTSK